MRLTQERPANASPNAASRHRFRRGAVLELIMLPFTNCPINKPLALTNCPGSKYKITEAHNGDHVIIEKCVFKDWPYFTALALSLRLYELTIFLK
jgi:hypothetical protein